MDTFRKHLQDLHLYFSNSANRTSALKRAASVLNVADLKVTVRENVSHKITNCNLQLTLNLQISFILSCHPTPGG